MKSLIITPMLPVLSGSDAGGKHRRAGMFFRALGQISDRIELVHLVPEKMLESVSKGAELDDSQSAFWGVPVHVTLLARRTRALTPWTYYGAGIFSAAAQFALYPYGGTAIKAGIGEMLDRKPDLVLADRLDAMLAIEATGRRPERLFWDMDDVYHRVLWRAAVQRPLRPGQLLTALQAPALALAERRAVARSTLTFVCSQEDASHLAKLGFARRVTVVPNTLSIPPTAPGVVADPTVLYLGSFHHPPNVLAAERLVCRIWPLVRVAVPKARLLIAGAGSQELACCETATPGAEFLGFVDDLAALYGRTRLVCTPITTGSGTRLKLVEAAAFGRPIVSTRLGAEGLGFGAGEILYAERDAALAEACVRLLRDDALCAQIGGAARRVAEERYSLQQVEPVITGLMSR